MNELKEMLSEMKKRPGMYIGEKSLTPLHHYINGYCHGLSKGSDKKVVFGGGFISFLHERHSELFLQSWWGWWIAILENTSSEEEAFDYFFVLLEEFWGEKL